MSPVGAAFSLLLLAAMDLKIVSAAVNGNVRAFNTLCSVIHIVKGDPQVAGTNIVTNVDEDIDAIRRLNLSLAEDAMFEADFKETPDDNKKPQEYQENREKWEADKKLIVAGKTDINGIKLKRIGTSHARQVASSVVNRSLKIAENLRKQLQSTATAETVRGELNKALYGTKGEESTTPGETYATNGDQGCGNNNPAGQTPGLSLLSDLVCLCATTTGNDSTCLGKSGSHLKYNNPTNAKTAAAELLKACPKHGRAAVTAGSLTTAKAMFYAALKDNRGTTQAENVILGSANAAQCNAGASGDCIYYKQPKADGTLEIPWLEKIDAAMDVIKTAAAETNVNAKIAGQVAALRSKALAAYIQETAGDKHSTQIANTPTTVPTQTTAESDCNKHQTSDKCKDPCKWNENATDKTKKCSLDSKAAVEKAGKDGITDLKCTGKEQKDCKDGCKWDGKECKDFCILAKKQLALIIYASMSFFSILEVKVFLLNFIKFKKIWYYETIRQNWRNFIKCNIFHHFCKTFSSFEIF
uniref:Variant surface glycoprotein 1125.4062 n=1 Tax=Trypanosoma brucei TaxID=5691 RepID=A0A1J0R9X7_9TRYP|nr:variant surface glycoprotein 1125.4062 [Trypanosoma brucei]